jgi:aspartyl-tRNA(Asn)/glutamyl-tRNA(Gln) amidotransferase subunit A
MDDPGLFAATNLLALRNTRVANLLGLPSITVPAGRDGHGLPVGLMLVGQRRGEARLLSLGLAIEQLIGVV